MSKTSSISGRMSPRFSRSRKAWRLFTGFIQSLMDADPLSPDADGLVERVRKEAGLVEISPEFDAMMKVAVSVIADLRLQGWSFVVEKKSVGLIRPTTHIDPELERHRVRQMHSVNRNAQLIKESVRDFVRGLERKRIGPAGWVSIFSLMRDGRELGEKLRPLTKMASNDERIAHLQTVIEPYLQVVANGVKCEHTGIPLADIWRYFRHTWSNEYQTVPGRNLMLLVRDAAVEHHPVIGIAAVTSPVVHLQIRDEWIGWTSQQFTNQLRENPTTVWAKWIESQLENLTSDIFIDDLIEDGIVAKPELVMPTEETLAALEEESVRARERHRLHPEKNIHKNPKKQTSDEEWLTRAKTDLFRSKRCSALASLLRARLRLKNAGFSQPTSACLLKALSSSEGRLAIDTIRKQVKAIHIGNDVLDISVCGAIAPYSELVGGKLVAMLLASPELVKFYAHKYGKAASIIASSMAGRRLTRKPKLTALTTTSLYGSEPNQYTRIKIPSTQVGDEGDGQIKYSRLGLTRGQGSYHFSAATVDAIEILLSQLSDNRSVNSIFGEGVNPRLRKIRTGLDVCGFPSDEVLTHGAPRIVYGVALTDNLRDVLLARVKRPRYLFSHNRSEETTQAIATYWMRRWLLRRAQRSDIVDRVVEHTLVSPVQHGARVTLPRIFDEEPLFFHSEQ
ncbi:Druantia anti-phage system protein DruA [Thalassoglobus sp.]|uniref:Druantia anti-phage system protein DruA n=1 Tax=Thalassoglobus sp. TaxID=2795869 RepID=UPI003AA7DB4A